MESIDMGGLTRLVQPLLVAWQSSTAPHVCVSVAVVSGLRLMSYADDLCPMAVVGAVQVVGSLIGSVRECQEMLDFCGEHNITADIELVPASYVNEAVARLDKADVKYRFVLDIEGTLVHA